MITIKNEKEIQRMREAGAITIGAIEEVGKHIRPGISTKELDKIAYDYIVSHGAKPSFLHYQGFPASICASVDEVVVHGIPSDKQILQEGQIIGIDCGAIYNGYQGDAARTFAVGKISEEKQKLIDVTKECFFEAIKDLKEGSRLGDIGASVQKHAEKHGYSVVREMGGHGIGRHMHEDPYIPMFGTAGTGIKLKAGMTLAIEPMVNMGRPELYLNGWDARTRDHQPSAHYENTVLITQTGAEILTKKLEANNFE
jgi:methionyl aminopeptidase